MRQLLGGKGANLAEMTGLGLPVPPGFTISTEACNNYYENDKTLDEEITAQAMAAWRAWRKRRQGLWRCEKPAAGVGAFRRLRSPMPGMMDTVLNLGLTDETARGHGGGHAKPTVCLRFLPPVHPDVCQRGDGAGMTPFEAALEAAKQAQGVKLDRDLSAESLMELVKTYQGLYEKATGKPFPQDPKEQLVRRHRGGVPFLEYAARQLLPPAQRYPVHPGHGGQRAVHGLWQYGRRLRHRRGLYPQPLYRGK